jgi:pimeloyl-ACP methyl ester carboxylesterase
VLPVLEEHHDVCALDLPGFGRAPSLRDGMRPTPATLADALECELDRLGLDAPVVVGNSLGGWLALELARRRRASRVVAIAPSGLELPAERAAVIAMNEMMRVRAKLGAPFGRRATDPLPLRLALFGGLYSRPWRTPPRDGAAELRAFGCSPGFQSTLWSTVGTRFAEGLPDISVPVRIAFGTLDLMLGTYTAPRFAALIPGAELVALPGLGHVPMRDAPRQVARAILDFTVPRAA